MIVIYNLICMAFFTLKTTANVYRIWVVAAGIAFAVSMLLLIRSLTVSVEPRCDTPLLYSALRARVGLHHALCCALC